MNRRTAIWLVAGFFAGLAGVLSVQPATAQGVSSGGQLTTIQKRLLSGFASFALDAGSALSRRPDFLAKAGLSHPLGQTAQALSGSDPGDPANYNPGGTGDCGFKTGPNVKVNQDCLNLSDSDLQGRGQAQNETSIAQDPNAPNHLVAAFNDYRRGDGNCGAAWSVNGGQTWNDSTVPTGFVRGAAFGGVAREYFQAAGDPSVAWDTKGNAYLSCQMFMRGLGTTNNPDQSSAFYVFRSTGNFGASWNFPGKPVAERNDTTGTTLLDKQLMTVDNTSGSPFQDRIYVTWTDFASDGSAYIFEAHSADYGQTFSAPVVVSADSALCPRTFGAGTPHGRCNENQFSQPFTGSDGALYVVWANFNNATSSAADNHSQILLAKSTDGGASFSAPVKVADYYDLPDCATDQQGQNLGRACVPEKGATANSFFRASNYPSGAVDPTDSSQIVVAFGSYINPNSKESNGCIPSGFSAAAQALYTGVKTAGACNNGILVSVSTNGGGTFTGTATDPRALTSATAASGQTTTDQWFQWIAFTKTGRLAISYYDRQYGDDETTGFSDVSLSGSDDFTNFGVKRVTSSSMPPPTQFGGLFWGDYAGLTATDQAHPIWSDTRNPELFLCPGTGVPGVAPAVCLASASNAAVANDQDIYTQSLGVSAH
jgi:hypothetical protein